MSRISKEKLRIIFQRKEYFVLVTFSPFVGAAIEVGIVDFVAGTWLRFNRIGLVSFVVVVVVGVVDFFDVNIRLVIDGTEQGNGMSIKALAI